MFSNTTAEWEQSPPLVTVTPEDHTAWIVIATVLGLVTSTFFTLIRIVVLWSRSTLKSWGNCSLAISMALLYIQSTLILSACSEGFGKAARLVSIDHLITLQQKYYYSVILSTVSIGLSRLSVVQQLQQLVGSRNHSMILKIAILLICIWTVVFSMALALQCTLSQPWIILGETCPGTLLRWQLYCASGITSEICLPLLAMMLFWKLQMPFSNKAGVILAFSFRIFNIIPIVFRLTTLPASGNSFDPILDLAKFTSWAQTEVNCSIVAANLPHIVPFVKSLSARYGGFNQTTDGQTHELNTLDAVVRKATYDGNETYKCVVAAASEHPRESFGSDDSQKRIIGRDGTINKRISFDVTHAGLRDT